MNVSKEKPAPCPAAALSTIADYAALGLPLLPGDILAIRRAAGELRRLAGDVERLAPIRPNIDAMLNEFVNQGF